jgi:hypothetical protein
MLVIILCPLTAIFAQIYLPKDLFDKQVKITQKMNQFIYLSNIRAKYLIILLYEWDHKMLKQKPPKLGGFC